MKTWNIIFKPDQKEKFEFDCPAGEKALTLTGMTTGKQDVENKYLFRTNIYALFADSRIAITPELEDLLQFALGVYTIDQVISRDEYGFQGWSRHLKIYVPVALLKEWSSVKGQIEELLSFLSGDRWEIVFRKRQSAVVRPSQQVAFPELMKPKIETVALFSGGLDSYISAINLLESGKSTCFVSHYKGGSEHKAQVELYEKLEKKYGTERITKFQVHVQPNQKHSKATKEVSSRARSFLFLCLGLTFAKAHGNDVPFIVPENGLISLNVPLTGTRLGSHSTRTTHPFFLEKFVETMKAVGIKNVVSNPHQFQTKGEMMEACTNTSFLKTTYGESLSCSHPDQSRYAGHPPGTHCGYCVPCIIRQAAEYKGKVKGTTYANDIIKHPPSPKTKSGSDLRAYKIGLKNLEMLDKKSILFKVLSSGPIPFQNKQELDKYTDVYIRGMNEVKAFLSKKK